MKPSRRLFGNSTALVLCAAACVATESFGQNLVAVGGTLMGGVQNGKLVELGKLSGWEAKAKAPWRVHAPGQAPRNGAFRQISKDEVHCGDGASVELKYDPFPADTKPEIALQGSWNPFPRLAKPQGTANQTYRTVIAETLTKLGLAKVPIDLGRIDRIDLDGDGTEEVVLQAQGTGPETKDGKLSHYYSLIVVRRLEKGKVVDHLLSTPQGEGSLSGKNMDWSSRMDLTLDGYADLDGDGTLEILVSEHGVDYGGDAVWKLGPNGPKLLAHESCGA